MENKNYSSTGPPQRCPKEKIDELIIIEQSSLDLVEHQDHINS